MQGSLWLFIQTGAALEVAVNNSKFAIMWATNARTYVLFEEPVAD